MGARQCRVTTQGDLHGRSKPPKVVVSIRASMQECGLGEIHFARYLLHPHLLTRLRKETNGGWVSRERSVGEGVDMDDL
jgi:hypothetical protein